MIAEKFDEIVKGLVDKYGFNKKDAIDRAREILETPEDDFE